MIQSLTDFFNAWTMTADAGRDALIASAFGDSLYYVDPRVQAPITDLGALCAYVAEFLPQCPPGARVVVADPVDEKHGHARATVHFVITTAMKQTGQYYVDLDANGKIVRLVGFLGKGAD